MVSPFPRHEQGLTIGCKIKHLLEAWWRGGRPHLVRGTISNTVGVGCGRLVCVNSFASLLRSPTSPVNYTRQWIRLTRQCSFWRASSPSFLLYIFFLLSLFFSSSFCSFLFPIHVFSTFLPSPLFLFSPLPIFFYLHLSIIPLLLTPPPPCINLASSRYIQVP